MAIITYTELQTAVANWLKRADLTARIPEFISLAEARISRNLRTRNVVANLSLDSTGVVSLPADLSELRYIRLKSADGNYNFPLEVTTPVAIADALDRWQGAGSVPVRAAVIEGKLYLAPRPDQTYTAEITYFQLLPPLTGGSPTNFVLTAAPDLYLAGTLIEAFLFLDYDERVAVWEQKFESALDELERSRESAEYGANPAPVRLPVVFE